MEPTHGRDSRCFLVGPTYGAAWNLSTRSADTAILKADPLQNKSRRIPFLPPEGLLEKAMIRRIRNPTE
jgi:hypothetical protein